MKQLEHVCGTIANVPADLSPEASPGKHSATLLSQIGQLIR